MQIQQVEKSMSTRRDEYLLEVQCHLIRCYSAIEQRLRSWCPGMNWGDEEIAFLKAEYQRREDGEQMLMILLGPSFQCRPNASHQAETAPETANRGQSTGSASAA
jgi:hypothetical protein